MSQIKSNEQLARGSKRKLLKFIWIPVLGAGLITTVIYALVNRVSYTYESNMMDENSEMIKTLELANVIKQDENHKQYYNFVSDDTNINVAKENIKTLIDINAKYVLYVGRGSCGDCSDMRDHVMPLISDKTIPLFYVDGDHFRKDGKWTNEWYDLFGSYDLKEDGYLKDYRFTYTPALNLVVNGRLAESFWEFGGPGKDATTDKQKANSLYYSRYNRKPLNQEQKEQGYKNAAWDIDRLFAKWKGY